MFSPKLESDAVDLMSGLISKKNGWILKSVSCNVLWSTCHMEGFTLHSWENEVEKAYTVLELLWRDALHGFN